MKNTVPLSIRVVANGYILRETSPQFMTQQEWVFNDAAKLAEFVANFYSENGPVLATSIKIDAEGVE